MATKLASLLVLLQFVCLALSQCPWTQSGVVYWSNPSSWPGNAVPGLGSSVVIPAGTKVVYDVTTPGITYEGITVSSGAELIFDGTKNVWMETKFINVNYGAVFRIGSASCHYSMKANIVLVGPQDTVTQVIPHMGVKNVIIQGLLEWYGSPPQPTWTNVAATVPVNATSIVVKGPLNNWNVGDSIAIASTDYYQDLTERFTITAISGNTITLSGKVRYMHYGAENEYAEVGHITRNIVVTGDSQSDAQGFGGHCIVIGQGIAHVYGVEFTKMGQKGVLARYPFHFHMMQDQIGRGHFVSECSFHDTYQRCLTIHMTSGVSASNNVGYNITGHCYFLEEGSETYNTLDHNLGMVINPGVVIPSDVTKPSVFWITNPNNTFTNNVAVGGVFGFWFALPLHPLTLSSYMTWIYNRYIPLLQFDNNVAHSCSDTGIFADDGPEPDGSVDEESSYTPLVGPHTATSQTWNQAPVRATLIGNNAYKNRQHGIWFRGSQITIKNSLLQDNGVGVNMPATGNLFCDSVIVGETGNIGTPGFTRYFNDFGRSRPMLWWASAPIQGFQGYDSTGGQFARNVTFVNFMSNSVRRAGAIGQITFGIYILPPNDMFAQITLINSNHFAESDALPWETRTYADYDGSSHLVMIDADGSLTGAYGNAITSNGSIYNIDNNCVPVPAWYNYFNCSKSVNGYSQINVINRNIAGTNFAGTNTAPHGYRATFIPFGKPAVTDNVTGFDPRENTRAGYATNVISRKGYLLKFPHPTPPSLQLSLRFASTGEWIVLALQYPSTTFSITRSYSNTPLTSVNSLALLTKLTFYYDTANEYLYVMYYEDNGNLVNNAGFPEYGYGGSSVNILAGCGTTCTVGSHSVPSTYVDGEDKYQVALKGCGAGTNSPRVGMGYIYLNPTTHVATYLIYHNIPDATTASIMVGGRLFQTLPVGQAPIRGSFELSWNKWNALWNGTWTVVVRSAAFPNGEIGGTPGCVSTCTTPPKISAIDYCAPQIGMAIYGDALNTTWYDWSWNSVRNYSYSNDKRCGVNSLSQYKYDGNWSALVFHTGNANCTPGNCDATWKVPYTRAADFSYFQFLVKSPAGPLPGPLVIQAQNSYINKWYPSFTLNYTNIDNFIIEESWTRVKIPLSLLGVSNTDFFGTIQVMIQTAIKDFTVLYDDIKLTGSYTDPITLRPYGSQYAYKLAC